jgi:hypothetical protein
MKLGPMRFALRAKVDEHVENEKIGFVIETGVLTGHSSFVFRPSDRNGTLMTIGIDYEVSNSLSGRALARGLDSILGVALKSTEDKLVAQIEGFDAELNGPRSSRPGR